MENMRESLIERSTYLTYMNVNEICTFMIDIKYYMFIKLKNDFKTLSNDKEIAKVYDMAKQFMREQGVLNYVLLEYKQQEYLKTCPCKACKNNLPCDTCGKITPFDPLNLKGPYRMACRKNKHCCLKCKIN